MSFSPRLRGALGGVALSLVLSVPAAASSVTLTQTGGDAFGSPNWSRNVTFSGPDRSGNFPAGPFRLSDGVSNLLAWCIEIAQNFGNGATYHTDQQLVGGTQLDLLDRLFTQNFETLGTGTSDQNRDFGAAMQLAIWEIVTETQEDQGALVLNLGSGAFTASSGSQADEIAQGWLDGLGSGASGDYDFTFFRNDTQQDLLVAEMAPVPLPAAGWLLVAGMGGLIAMRRRTGA